MDEIERELRETLSERRLSLPVRPDAVALLKAGVRRRRRNRAVATMSAAVVLLAGGVTAASLAAGRGTGSERIVPPVGGGSRTPAVKPTLPAPTVDEVPWAATGYDYHHPPAFPGAVADPSVPWCRADQLALSQSFQGETGSWGGVVAVTNTSATTCAVQGQPAVSMAAGDGRILVASRPEPFYVDAWVPLSPGKDASAFVVWYPELCNEPVPASLLVDLPHSGGRLSTAMQGGPRCDVKTAAPSAGHLDVDGFVRVQGSPFTPQAGLQARVDKADLSVAPGATLDYRLHLQSMDAPSVALNPCLPYRERLVDRATQKVLIEELHLLNCGDAPADITDPQSRHDTFFDLELRLPADAPTGNYDLVWQSVLKPVATVGDQPVHVTPPVPPCRDGQLTASAGPGGAATGHYGMDIVLHNIGATTCSLRGYPGVRLLDAAGHVMQPSPQRGSGFVFADPGPSTIVLEGRTGVASFAVGGADYDPVHERACPWAAEIGVFAPDTRSQLIVQTPFPACASGVNFSAVVPGRLGPRS